jgi:hypothetical protein
VALDRKDIRAKLDPDIHEALAAICEADDVDIGAFIEAEIERIVRKRVHDAQTIAAKVPRLGKSGSGRE